MKTEIQKIQFVKRLEYWYFVKGTAVCAICVGVDTISVFTVPDFVCDEAGK